MKTLKIHSFIDPSDYGLNDLNGYVYMDKDDWPEKLGEYDFGFVFYMGPSVTIDGSNRLSDCIGLNLYLMKISKELGVFVDVDVAENCHMILSADDKEQAEEIYQQIKTRIQQDFEIVK
jgi:hypothetical protein